MSAEYMCKNCGRSFTRCNSLNTICQKCQYNKYAKPRKSIKRIGPVARQWIETRQLWIDTHPPKRDYWDCYLCGKKLTIDTLTIDHMKSRGHHPEYRFDMDNLAPCCWRCNEKKGSKDYEIK
jgi:5-methylcytosine-specific restriction endonuclease McrA